MAKTVLTKFLKLLAVQFFAAIFSIAAYSQQMDSIENKWKEFNHKLEMETNNHKSILDSIDKLVMKMPGIENLKEKLTAYKKIAWSSAEEKWRRQQYWWYLSNNARMRGEYGLLIFYIEMRQQEVGKKRGGRPVTIEKIALFSLAHSPHKSVKEYESLSKYVETLPQQIDTGTLGPDTYTILSLMIDVVKNYSLLGDTTNIVKLVNDADAIYNAVLHNKEKKTYGDVLSVCNQLNIFIKYFSDVFFGKMDVAENRIKNLLSINSKRDTSGTELLTSGIKYEILQETTLFYIKVKKPDSASHYLELARQQLALFGNPIEYKIKLLVFDASISEQQKQYQKGYQKMKEAYALTDSFIGSRQIEIADNMYAQAESAFTQEQLVGITQEKNKITFWAFSIGIVLLIIIATLYSIMKAKGRKAKAQLESLDNATQLQVAELEEHNRMMVLAEKKKLGMELHDDLAGTLAAIKMQLATEALHTTDNSLQTKLQAIGNQVGLAYENTRNKSHEWFRAANEGSESAFSERIHAITEKVLPDDVYQKEITIDDYALRKIELPVKVQLLRIIQESVANILKHAKAHKVAILIYEELNGLVLKISDNGRGFDAQLQYKGRGIGMLSIKARVAELKGSIEIVSGKNGTEITVVIPT